MELTNFMGHYPYYQLRTLVDSCKVCGLHVPEHAPLPIKTRPHEHTVIQVFVRFTITKRIAASTDVDTQISEHFAVV